MFNYTLLFIIFLIELFELIAQSNVKYFHHINKSNLVYFIIAIISYCIVANGL